MQKKRPRRFSRIKSKHGSVNWGKKSSRFSYNAIYEKTAILHAGKKKGEKKIRAADSDLLAPSICHRSARIVDWNF